MAVIVPEITSFLPWEVWILAIERKKNPEEFFKRVQKTFRGKAGFIIGGWVTSSNLPEYWLFQGAHYQWERFDDASEPQYPQMYKTFKAILKRIEKIRQELDEPERFFHGLVVNVGIALWFHPDFHDNPLERYQQITGGKFPGSPRH